jgi:hypothetical protein
VDQAVNSIVSLMADLEFSCLAFIYIHHI